MPSDLLESIQSQRPTVPLFHYTSPEGLIGIVQSKCLRASGIHYLNDTAEFKHAASIVARRAGNSVPPTRLTQQRRTEATGKVWISLVDHPKTDHLCRGCGKKITNESTNCAHCAVDKATERLIGVASLGRKAALSPESRAKHGATRRRHAKACSEWDASKQPAWITDRVYTEEVQPQLSQMSTSAIASRIGVSRWYAGRIRQGYRPHPRHWQALAQLMGVRQPNPAKAL
jgi:hypothetical protein